MNIFLFIELYTNQNYTINKKMYYITIYPLKKFIGFDNSLSFKVYNSTIYNKIIDFYTDNIKDIQKNEYDKPINFINNIIELIPLDPYKLTIDSYLYKDIDSDIDNNYNSGEHHFKYYHCEIYLKCNDFELPSIYSVKFNNEYNSHINSGDIFIMGKRYFIEEKDEDNHKLFTFYFDSDRNLCNFVHDHLVGGYEVKTDDNYNFVIDYTNEEFSDNSDSDYY